MILAERNIVGNVVPQLNLIIRHSSAPYRKRGRFRLRHYQVPYQCGHWLWLAFNTKYAIYSRFSRRQIGDIFSYFCSRCQILFAIKKSKCRLLKFLSNMQSAKIKVERKAMIRNRYSYLSPSVQDTKGKE